MIRKLFVLFKVVVFIHLLIYLVDGEWTATFICLFNLLLFFLVDYVQKNIMYSDKFKLLIYIFLFGSLVGGEVYNLYSEIWFFDIVLHLFSSFIVSGLFVYVFRLFKCNINRFLFIICIFCFAMMIASLWEITEFSIDRLFDKDMQKDTVVNEVNSMFLSSDGNSIIKVNVDSMSIGGTILDGYLDIGLYDTVEDMICATLGSIIYLIIDRRKIKEASLV